MASSKIATLRLWLQECFVNTNQNIEKVMEKSKPYIGKAVDSIKVDLQQTMDKPREKPANKMRERILKQELNDEYEQVKIKAEGIILSLVEEMNKAFDCIKIKAVRAFEKGVEIDTTAGSMVDIKEDMKDKIETTRVQAMLSIQKIREELDLTIKVIKQKSAIMLGQEPNVASKTSEEAKAELHKKLEEVKRRYENFAETTKTELYTIIESAHANIENTYKKLRLM